MEHSATATIRITVYCKLTAGTVTDHPDAIGTDSVNVTVEHSSLHYWTAVQFWLPVKVCIGPEQVVLARSWERVGV